MILILLITYSPQLPTPSDCVRTPSVGRPPPLQGWDFACSQLLFHLFSINFFNNPFVVFWILYF